MKLKDPATQSIRTLVILATCALALFASEARAYPAGRPVSQQSSGVNAVAAENFYGDIARQLGGSHATVTSILSDPNADPHEYESTTNDARAVAAAQLVILNGVGYDAFMNKLLAGSPNPSRLVINVADLTGKTEGDNPHLWYNVDWMAQLSGTITGDLKQLDPADSADFDKANSDFLGNLQLLRDTIATIRAQYAGTRVAQTEPVAGYMMSGLGISVDDGDFQHAIEEGNDPSPQSVAAMTALITKKQVALLLYNIQTVTPITEQLKAQARQAGIPVVGVTETQPLDEPTYQQWMLDQLNQLQKALAGS